MTLPRDTLKLAARNGLRYSFDEIAFLENKSKTQVHRIHAGAMEKMRSEASTHAFPVLIAASAASRALEPTAEQSARFWQGFLAKHGGEVGIPAPEDDDPPESGVCRPGPSSRPPAGRSPKQRAFRALSVIGPLAGLLLAVPVADATRRTHDREPVLAANLAPMPAAGPMAVAGMAISSAATANAAGSAGATNSMVVVVSAAPGSTPTAPRTLRGYDDRGDPDRALRDQWREAAAIGNWTRACVALEKHARLYPRGQSAAARDQLRNAVCGAPRANSTRLQ